MTSIFKIVALAMVVGVLCVGAVALATDFAWDANTADTNWKTVNNWDLDSSYPQNANDNATMTAGGNTITMNDTSTLTVNRITLGGASPTKRKLHVKDAALVSFELFLQDYADVDADKNFSVVQHTEISDNVWIDVADGALVNLTASGQDHQALHVESAQATLNLTTNTTGLFQSYGILIDADTANAGRALKVAGGTLTITNGGVLEIRSDTGADNNRAKLWVASGTTLDMEAGAYVEIFGGTTFPRRAELDLDVSMTLTTFDQGGTIYPGKIVTDGHAVIDLAANETVCIDRLVLSYLYGGTVTRLTAGSGAAIKVNVATCP